MVTGIDKFRDQYAIIGGAACDLLFNAAGLDFRATKDIDMVLCVEVVNAEFGRAFQAFLDAGGYQARERSDGRRDFYRFHKPADRSFPFMIKLFSRRPVILDLPKDAIYTRVPVDQDMVSLSAILLNDAYFKMLQAAKRQVGGITVVDETLLIPFKARAIPDLAARSNADGNVNRKDIRKHRNDVFRLAQLLRQNEPVELPEPGCHDLQTFVDPTHSDETLDPRAFGVPFTRDDAADLLRSVCGLTQKAAMAPVDLIPDCHSRCSQREKTRQGACRSSSFNVTVSPMSCEVVVKRPMIEMRRTVALEPAEFVTSSAPAPHFREDSRTPIHCSLAHPGTRRPRPRRFLRGSTSVNIRSPGPRGSGVCGAG